MDIYAESYAKLLQDPRWNEKRIHILKRDNFTCQECGAKDVPLDVHHHFYYPETMPWDYDDEVLISLCRTCHENEEWLKSFDQSSFQYLLTIGFTRASFNYMIREISLKINLEGIDQRLEIRRIIEKIKIR